MNRIKILVLPLALAIVPLAACKSRQEAPPPSSTKPIEPGTPPVAQPTSPSGVGAGIAQDRDLVLQQMQAKLADLDAKLVALRRDLAARSDQLAAAGTAELADAITKLEESRDKLQLALDEAKHTAADGWDQVKQRASDELQRAENAYEAALRELRK